MDVFPGTLMLEQVILNDQQQSASTDMCETMCREVDISDIEIRRMYLSA